MILLMRGRSAALSALVLLVSACSAGHSGSQTTVAPLGGKEERYATTGTCDASRAQFSVGSRVSAALMEKARVVAGAGVARVLRRDQTITLEHSDARLNLEVDGRGVVVSVRCG